MAAGALGKLRTPWVVVVFTIITLGFYGLYWQYSSFKEIKDHSGLGLDPVIGLVLAIFLFIVNAFVIPSEVGGLYTRQGTNPSPMTALSGFWVFVPFVGGIIWIVKVQRRLNEYWLAHGAVPTAS